jgi:hypothetical protein
MRQRYRYGENRGEEEVYRLRRSAVAGTPHGDH